MKKLYGFYRREQIGTLNLGQVSLNGGYTISFFANGQYADWVNAGLISIKDQEIPENRYTKEIIPGIKDLREFIYLEYNENVVDILLTTNIIKKIGARFDLELFDDIEQAKTFIREHTNLVEETPGYFILSEETIGINGEIIPKKYLIID